MNAVGIDVSKGKSMVTILRPFGEIVSRPHEIQHTTDQVDELVQTIRSLEGETRVVMEYTGRYYEPMARWLCDAGLFVSVVNPKLIKDFDNDSLRKVKTDKADSEKIARYTLDKWTKLRKYGHTDGLRSQLKTMNRQFVCYIKTRTAMKNNLISLLDQTFPGANTFFDTPARSDGSQKWVDFVYTYWHVDRIRKMSLSAFADHYKNWCKRHDYMYQPDKPTKIYKSIKSIIPVLPQDDVTKYIIRQAVEQVNSASAAVETLRTRMQEVASQLPEYAAVIEMAGVGPTLGPQLIAEIGDVTRFSHKGALTAFAGLDPGRNDSGAYSQKSVPTSKRGSSSLRRTLYLIMTVLIAKRLQGDPVYDFLDKKRAQGKPYFVYMTAGANKFLRVYYGRVKEYLGSISNIETE